MFAVCKETNTKKKLEFLFDLFANHTETMKKKAMRDFAEIFKLGAGFFNARGALLYQGEFIDDTLEMNIDFSLYEKARYTMMAMMGLKPSSDEDEREAILSVLGNNHNIEGYIQQHLEIEDVYYIVEKQFFDAWSMNVDFIDDKNYIIKKEKINVIDNLELIEPMHDKRTKEI